MNSQEESRAQILETVRRYWGFERLLPLQEEASLDEAFRNRALVLEPGAHGQSSLFEPARDRLALRGRGIESRRDSLSIVRSRFPRHGFLERLERLKTASPCSIPIFGRPSSPIARSISPAYSG